MGYRGPTACAAAGITYRQLDYWARTDLVVPSVRSATGSGSQRLYSFKDILVLKVVKRLLDTGVSLQNIRSAVDHLRARGVDDLARITLLSDGTTVYECTSSEEVVDLLRGGQGVFGIAVSGALRELIGHLPSCRASGPMVPTRRRLNRASEQPGRAGPAAAAAHRCELISCRPQVHYPDRLAAHGRLVSSNVTFPARESSPGYRRAAPKGQLPRNLSGTRTVRTARRRGRSGGLADRGGRCAGRRGCSVSVQE